MVVLSALLVFVSIAVFATVYASASHQEAVLIITHTIEQGQPILAQDLGQTSAAISGGVVPIPVSDVSVLSGRRAAVTIPSGSLLTVGDTTYGQPIPSGYAVVGLALKPGQLPSVGVQPGDQVMVVETGTPGTPIASQQSSTGNSADAPSDSGVLVPQARVFEVAIPSTNQSPLNQSSAVRRRVRTGVGRGVGHTRSDGVHRGRGQSGESGAASECTRRSWTGKRGRGTMTVAAIASVKGAPGVTTLACLVAASWPDERDVVLVEGDPSGGDLAARFRLSTRRGWSSFAAASRRLDGNEAIGPHVQQLPGGLDVTIGAKSLDPVDQSETIASLLVSADSQVDGPRDVIADIGRLMPGARGVKPWLERSTVVVIVLRRDAASILHVRDRVDMLQSICSGRVGLVIVGAGSFTSKEIGRFTGIPVLADLPDDPNAALIVGGQPGGQPSSPRRLSRSLLVMSSWRLAITLSRDDPFVLPGGDGVAPVTWPRSEGGVEPKVPVTTRRDRWRQNRGSARGAGLKARPKSRTGEPVKPEPIQPEPLQPEPLQPEPLQPSTKSGQSRPDALVEEVSP